MAHLSIWPGDMTDNTFLQDFSPLVLTPPLPGAEISLWPLLGKLTDGTNFDKYEWIEEEVSQITLSGTEGSGDGWNSTTDTSWDFTSGQCAAAGLRAGAQLKNATDRTKKEVVLVTAVSTDTVTVTRDYGGFVSGSGGGTTGEAHAVSDTFEIMGYTNFSGSGVTNTDDFVTRDRSPKYNYYSILDDWTQVTAEDLVRVYRGNNPDNWGYQMNGLKQRLDRQFEKHLIHAPQVDASDSSTRSSMGGLVWYATQTSGAEDNSYITTSENYTYEVFDDGMKYLYEQGTLDGSHDIVCLMPPAGIQVAAYTHESALRGEYINEKVRGLQCTKVMSTITGDMIPLVPCRNIPSDSFMLLNLNSVRVHFLEGLALAIATKEVGEQLDMYRAARPYSVMTFEAQRPVDNTYFHTGVTFTRPS